MEKSPHQQKQKRWRERRPIDEIQTVGRGWDGVE